MTLTKGSTAGFWLSLAWDVGFSPRSGLSCFISPLSLFKSYGAEGLIDMDTLQTLILFPQISTGAPLPSDWHWSTPPGPQSKLLLTTVQSVLSELIFKENVPLPVANPHVFFWFSDVSPQCVFRSLVLNASPPGSTYVFEEFTGSDPCLLSC